MIVGLAVGSRRNSATCALALVGALEIWTCCSSLSFRVALPRRGSDA